VAVTGGLPRCCCVAGCSVSPELEMLSSYRTQAAAAPPSTAASAIAATMALLLPRGRRVGSTGSVRSARAGLGERRGSGGRSGCRTGAGRRAGPRSSASCARAFSASSGSTSASSGLSGSTRRAYLARVDQGVPPSARLPVSRGARGRGRTQAATRTAVVTNPAIMSHRCSPVRATRSHSSGWRPKEGGSGAYTSSLLMLGF